MDDPSALKPDRPAAPERGWFSIGEVFFVVACAALVLAVALVQILVVMGVPTAEARPHFFALPVLVGAFFGTLLVIIRQLRASVQSQHAQIVRLNRDLTRDLESTDRKLKTAHKELKHGERLKVMGLLGAQVAHDFNNLLTAIVATTSLLQLDHPDDAELQKHLSVLLKASDQASALCHRLLTFSKPIPENAATHLGKLLSEMEPILAKLVSDAVELRIEQEPDLPLIAADRGQVEMCILNLVVNANDATPAGTIVIQTRSQGERIELSVSDDGEGMDEETIRNSLNPFFTTKGERGTGLGVSVIRDAMEQSGGAMEVSSRPGAGTSVLLSYVSVRE